MCIISGLYAFTLTFVLAREVLSYPSHSFNSAFVLVSMGIIWALESVILEN